MANLMAIPHGAMEAAQDVGLDGMAPGLTPLPTSTGFPVTIYSGKFPLLSYLHAPIYTLMMCDAIAQGGRALLPPQIHSIRQVGSSHLVDQKTKAQRGYVPCPRPQAGK